MRKTFFAMAVVIATCRVCPAQWHAPDDGLPEQFIIGIDTAADVVSDDYRSIADAGFNLVIAQRPGESFNTQMLKACEGTGLRCVVWDPRISTPALGESSIRNEAIQHYRGFPALTGFRTRNNLPVAPAETLEMWTSVISIGNADPERFRYLEACHPSEFSDDRQFSRYIRTYLTRGLGYALYNEDNPYSFQAVDALRKMADACKRGNDRMWRRCRLRDTSPAMIRWQAYSSAAAGARGIIYGVVRPIADVRTDSLLDAAGTHTPAYQSARQVNRRLEAVGPALMNASPGGMYTIGAVFDHEIPSPDNSPVAAIDSSVKDDGYLVGLLAEGRYAFVVRKPEGDEAADVTIRCAGGGKAFAVETGKPSDRLSLLPGEGRLLEIR